MKKFYLGALLVGATMMFACGGAKPKPQPTTTANVRLFKQLNSDNSQFRVEGATGKDEAAAKKSAAAQALAYAAKQLTGDPKQKTAAGEYVNGNLIAIMPMATPGKIFKRGFSGKGPLLSLMVNVNMADLKRHLEENKIITTGRDLAKEVGRPNIMVVFNQGDCARGSDTAEICVLPKQIKAQGGKVESAKAEINKFQATLIEAKCMIATETSVEAESETTDKSKASSSSRASSASSVSARSRRSSAAVITRRGAAGASRSSGSMSGSRRSSSAASSSVQMDKHSRSKFSAKSIKASANCKKFMNRFGDLERRLRKEQNKIDGMQDKLDAVRADILKNDITTDKVGEWFTKNQWDVVDRGAITKAQRTQDAMVNVEGLSQDPIAALAQLAGSDIFVTHGFTESNAGGGYQVEVNIKAFEVASGKLLASKVGKSSKMASKERGNATSAAVGRAMPEILDQIKSYWAIMGREGVKTKVVFRGDFGKSKAKRKLRKLMKRFSEALDGCDKNCAWEKGMSTKMTISGQYTLPAKARSEFGDILIEELEEEGFTVEAIITNKTLSIIQIIR